MVFHKQLDIMLSREILIFDTTTNQSLGSVVLERSRTNFIQVSFIFLTLIFIKLLTLSFLQMCLYKETPDVLLCLHEDGVITAWRKKKVDLVSSHNYEVSFNFLNCRSYIIINNYYRM